MAGVVIVAGAGLAVGVGVGGKTKTATTTATVTVTSAALATTTSGPPRTDTTVSTTTQTTPPPTSTGTRTPPPTGTQQYYADYLAQQDTSTFDNNATNASLISDSSSVQLKGQSYLHAVALKLSPPCCGGGLATFRAQLQVPGFSRFSSKLAGLDTSTAAGDSYKLTIYKNDEGPTATVLFGPMVFTGPYGTHKIEFATQGATDLLFVWTSHASNSATFIMADPVVMP